MVVDIPNHSFSFSLSPFFSPFFPSFPSFPVYSSQVEPPPLQSRAKDRTDFDWVQSRSKKKNGAGSRADFKILPFSQFYAVFMPFSCR